MVFEERNGLLVIEAEHFSQQRKDEVRRWYVVSTESEPAVQPDPDPSHAATASGGAYLEILPDTRVTHDDPLTHGVSFSNSPGVLGILDYDVYFNTPGRYYVWVRAYPTGTEDNGIHVGIDGRWPAHGQRMQWCVSERAWTWMSKQRTNENHCGVEFEIYIDVDEPGLHTISFSMREDGFEFDRFLMTQSPKRRDPHEIGLEESPEFTGTPRGNNWWAELPHFGANRRIDEDLGHFYAEQAPWVDHQYLGWMIDDSVTASSLWWWQPDLGWIWTSRKAFPLVYRFSDSHWYYLFIESEYRQVEWLYNMDTGDWRELETW